MALLMQSDYQGQMFKLLVIGDSGVGKTCVILRFCDGNFAQTHLATIGIDFKIKNISVDGQQIKLQIWDTAGQERFKTITTTYYKGAHGIILVYDVTNERSFNSVGNWLQQIQQNANENIVQVLIGNKCDKVDQKVISTERGQKLAQEHQMIFFETSAKLNQNINQTFEEITKQIKKNKQSIKQENIEKTVQLSQVSNNQAKEGKKSCCK